MAKETNPNKTTENLNKEENMATENQQTEVTEQEEKDAASQTEQNENSENATELSELEIAQAALKKSELERSELRDKMVRLMADFDNLRKRHNREKLEMMDSAAKGIVIDLLPVLDDFERAFKAGDSSKEGYSLILNKFKSILDQQGLKEMNATGEDFDPDLHEALTEIPAPTKKLKGKVVDEVEKGYYLNEKIIRFAKVVVGK